MLWISVVTYNIYIHMYYIMIKVLCEFDFIRAHTQNYVRM